MTRTETLIFNKQTGQWGTSHDASQDLAEVPLKWSQGSSSHEQFTMELEGGALRMLWGQHVLELPLEAK